MKGKREKISILIILITTFLTFLAFLVFSSSGYALVTPGVPFFNLSQTSYGPGQIIDGFLNFSLTNHPGDSIVRATVAGRSKEMKLIDFLRNATTQFSCDPSDCNITYTASNPSASKLNVPLTVNEEKYFGLVAQGTNVQISNLTMIMLGPSSNTESVCYETPLKFDLLNDGTIDFEYRATTDEWCGIPRFSECFNMLMAQDAYFNQNVPFCQKVWLNKTGKVKVEAYMKCSDSSQLQGNDIKFLVYDSNGTLKGSCTVDWFDSSDYSYVGCLEPIGSEEGSTFYIENPGYYYACVMVTTSSAPVYSIKAEFQAPVCGHPSAPVALNTTDFAIRVQEAKFAPFTEEAIFNQSSTIGYLQNYIQTKYNNNCTGQGQGCVIPMKFISLANQTINLDSVNFRFVTGSVTLSNDNFYDLLVLPPKLNMTMQQVQLRALNLSAPEQQTTYYMTVMIVGGPSGSATFKVEPVPQIRSVFPLTTIPGESTMFRVIATAPPGRNIVSYSWNWGDGTAEITTTEPNATHTYAQGTFTLTVKVTDNASMIGSKSFTITSNVTKEMLNSTINTLIARANSLSYQYNAVEPWYREMLGLNLTQTIATLTSLQQQLPSATQTQLASIKQQLDSLDVPLNITEPLKLLESTYYTNLEEINPQHVTEISQESYDPNLEEQYKNAIVLWQEENVALKISGFIKSIVYDGRTEDKVTVVDITLLPTSPQNNVYLIFSLPSGVSYNNVKFKESYETSDLTDAIGFYFSDLSSSETITIALAGKHDFSTLSFYVSPKLEELEIDTGVTPGKEKAPPWGVAILFMILIALSIAIAIWFIWKSHAEKLEKKLFKNPTDIYNLMNFISGAKAKGMRKDEIYEQLIKAGWNKQQINYVWKKLEKQEKKETQKANFPYKSI